ncbi:MAG: hypothetical protein P1P89_10750 [Desulfobacterales bacterium]|nr:hypothetical protein [Desulfobacterales bacterium]
MKLLFYISITLAVAGGLLFPALGAFSGLIPVMIAGMLFINFLDAKIDMAHVFRKELLITFFLTVFFMPFITHNLLSIWFEAPYRVGLLLVACAPTGVMGIILIRYLQHRDFHLAFSNFLFSTFGSILVIPFVLKLFLGETAPIESRPILIQTAALIIIPYIATRLVERFCRKTLQQSIKKTAVFLTPVVVFMIVSTTIASASDDLKWNMTLLSLSSCVFAIYLLQGSLGYLAGYLLRKRDIKNTLALIASSRNCQIILAVAILNFSPLTAVPIIIATIFHHLMNAIWLWVLQRN